MKKVLKITATILYVVYSYFSLLVGIAGIFGEPVPEESVMLGCFFTKLLATIVGFAALFIWYHVSNYLKNHGYVYSL